MLFGRGVSFISSAQNRHVSFKILFWVELFFTTSTESFGQMYDGKPAFAAHRPSTPLGTGTRCGCRAARWPTATAPTTRGTTRYKIPLAKGLLLTENLALQNHNKTEFVHIQLATFGNCEQGEFPLYPAVEPNITILTCLKSWNNIIFNLIMSHCHIFLGISLPLPVTLHVHNFQRLQDHNSQQLFRGDTNPQYITNDLFLLVISGPSG